jgi:hemoglobin/transferrin/lactoferrin receptor protein
MRLYITIILLFLLSTAGKAQVISIRDSETKSPLAYSSIFTADKTIHTTTNLKGQADITNFKGADSIFFSQLGYQYKVLSYRQLEEMKFKVFLEIASQPLNELVVSAHRNEKERKDFKGKITRITRRDIAFYNPQTAADLLGTSGEVFIQKSQQGGGSPMIRGFAANRVLISVDGVRMNNAIFRSGNLHNVISLDPFSIEKVEVLHGPGAVVSGSDAIGGAMAFYTLMPKFSNKNKPLSLNATIRHSTVNEEKTANIGLNLGYEKIAFLTNFTYSDFGNLRMGSYGPDDYLRPHYATRIRGKDTVVENPNPRLQIHTGYSQLNLMQKVRLKAGNFWDITYGFHYSGTTDIPRYDRLIEYRKGQLRDAEWYYGPQVWRMNNITISHNKRNLLYDQVKIILAHQYFEESRLNRSFGSNSFFIRKEQVNATSINIDFEKNISATKALLYGIEAINNGISSTANVFNLITGSRSPILTRYPDGSQWNSTAAFVNFLQNFGKKFSLQSGLRYSHFFLDADFDTSMIPLPVKRTAFQSGALTGSIGVAYKPTEPWQLNLNFSSGFRAPNIDDIGKVFDSEPGAVIVPNQMLKPERAYNAEAGVSRKFGKSAILDVTGFYTILNDAMVRREFIFNSQDSILYDGEMSRVLAIQNAAKAYVYGLQSSFEIKFPWGFSYLARITYQNGREELDEGFTAPLRHAVPFFGFSRINWKFHKLVAEINAMYQGRISFEGLPPSEQAKPHLYALDQNQKPYSPAWHTLNFRIGYQFFQKSRFNFGIDNILDNRYRPYSSGLAGPGRNFTFSLTSSF